MLEILTEDYKTWDDYQSGQPNSQGHTDDDGRQSLARWSN